jgi:hypothetical protein
MAWLGIKRISESPKKKGKELILIKEYSIEINRCKAITHIFLPLQKKLKKTRAGCKETYKSGSEGGKQP